MNNFFKLQLTDSSVADQRADAADDSPSMRKTESGSHSVKALVAFFITVFASMAAAAAVVSNDIPLMVVGL